MEYSILKPFGVLNIAKPASVSSRKVVDMVARQLPKKTKVGHAGTLDPMATGVLVVAVGPATRLIQYTQLARKTYVGSFRLGLESDTEDITGSVLELVNAPRIAEEDLKKTLNQFTGIIEQTPPQFSAVKVDGVRAYKAARRGETIEIKSRPTVIHNIRLLRFNYPDFTIEIECGKGTYVRTLGRDIAKKLNSDAVMTELERTAVGDFKIEDAYHVESVTSDQISALLADPILMVDDLPKVTLRRSDIENLRDGKRIDVFHGDCVQSLDQAVAINEEGQILAVLEKKTANQYGAKINFVPQLYHGSS